MESGMTDEDEVDPSKGGAKQRLELIDLERTRHFRVAAALNGYGTLTLEDIYIELINELRSNAALSRDLREAMADALHAGLMGEDRVRMKIEAPGSHFRGVKTSAAAYRLIEAGRYISIEKKKNRAYSSIYADLKAKFSIEDTQDYGRRARKIFAEFIEFCKSNMDDIALWSASIHVETKPGQNSPVEYDEALILYDEDVFYYARSAFIDSITPSND